MINENRRGTENWLRTYRAEDKENIQCRLQTVKIYYYFPQKTHDKVITSHTVRWNCYYLKQTSNNAPLFGLHLTKSCIYLL